MKLCVLILGLFGITSASQSITPTTIDDISTCLNAAGIVTIPIILNMNHPMLGNLILEIMAKLDCSFLASLVSLSTEGSYSEFLSGSTTDFTLELLTPNLNLIVNSDVIIRTNLAEQITGTCITDYKNFSIDIDVEATFLTGDPTSCEIEEIDVDCNYSTTTVTASGPSSTFTQIITLAASNLSQKLFAEIEIKITNILKSCV